MLTWSLTFFAVAAVAALCGFDHLAAGSAEIARICFVLFDAAFVAGLLWSLGTGRRSRPTV